MTRPAIFPVVLDVHLDVGGRDVGKVKNGSIITENEVVKAGIECKIERIVFLAGGQIAVQRWGVSMEDGAAIVIGKQVAQV